MSADDGLPRETGRNDADDRFRGVHPEARRLLLEILAGGETASPQGFPRLWNPDVLAGRELLLRSLERMRPESRVQLDDYQDRLAISMKYGPYPRTKPVLHLVQEEGSPRSGEEFLREAGDAMVRLRLPHLDWTTFLPPYSEHDGRPILRIALFAAARDHLLRLMREDDAQRPGIFDPETLHYHALLDLAREVGEALGAAGLPAFVPRRVSRSDPDDADGPRNGHAALIDIRFAGKDMVEFGYSDYILERAASPIEVRLAGALVLQGVPPILQVRIHDPEYDDALLCKPDLLIPVAAEPLAVFADGAEYHGSRQAQTHDRRVDRRLQELGYRVLRVSGSDVHAHLERVVEDVKGTLFGRAARRLPEEFWVPKLQEALALGGEPEEEPPLRRALRRIERGERIGLATETELARICARRGVHRPYPWLDVLSTVRFAAHWGGRGRLP